MTKTEKKNLPDPHHSYERADPNAESGMGSLDQPLSTPVNRPDPHQNANGNRPGGKAQPADKSLDEAGSIDEVEVGVGQEPNTPEEQIEGSMQTEPPLGEDLMPTDISDPQQKRHPRPDGKGGSERDSAHRHDDKT